MPIEAASPENPLPGTEVAGAVSDPWGELRAGGGTILRRSFLINGLGVAAAIVYG